MDNTQTKEEPKKQSKIAGLSVHATEIELNPDLFKWKVYLAGHSGSGKTLISTTLPGRILFVDFDGRAETLAGSENVDILSCHESDAHSPRAWLLAEKIRQQIISEVRQGIFPYDSIVWDGLTMLGRYCLNWALTLDPGRGLGGAPAQQHYLPTMDNLAKFVLSTLALPVNILYTGHIDAIEDKLTGKIAYLPKIVGKLRTELSNWFSETYYCYRLADPKEKKTNYFWNTAGTAQKEFFKSSINKLGKYWSDPILLDFDQEPVGFQDLFERRFLNKVERRED